MRLHTPRLAYCLVLALTGAGVMLLAIAYGATSGELAAEGGAILGMPWGVVTLVDVYVGLALFSGWVLWREGSSRAAVAWIAAILTAGNLATCCYVLKAAMESRSDPDTFWMGRKHVA